MRKRKVILCIFLASIFTACVSDDDEEEMWNAAEVCPESKRGTFTDERDGQVYKYTTIGNQVWMAENLKYDAEYSVCLEKFDKYENFCNQYGRFYSLQKNEKYRENLDENLVSGVCPAGWHVPSLEEWKTMIEMMGGFLQQSSALRLKSGNEWANGTGENSCGFSAKPAGVYVNEEEGVHFARYDAVFWTSTKEDSQDYYTIKIEKDVTVFNHFPKMSIRCLKD